MQAQTPTSTQISLISFSDIYKLHSQLESNSLKLFLSVGQSQSQLKKYQLSISDLNQPETKDLTQWFDTVQDLYDHLHQQIHIKVNVQEGKLLIVGKHPSKKNTYVDIGTLQLSQIKIVEPQKNKEEQSIGLSLENIQMLCQQQNQIGDSKMKGILKLIVSEFRRIKANIFDIQMDQANQKKQKNKKMVQKIVQLNPQTNQFSGLIKKQIQTIQSCNQNLLININKINSQSIETDKKLTTLFINQSSTNQKINILNKQIQTIKNQQKLTVDLISNLTRQNQVKLKQMQEKKEQYLFKLNIQLVDLSQKLQKLGKIHNEYSIKVYDKINSVKAEINDGTEEKLNHLNTKIISQQSKKFIHTFSELADYKKQVDILKNEIRLIKQNKLDKNSIKNFQDIPNQISKNKREVENSVKNIFDTMQENKKQIEKDVRILVLKYNKIQDKLSETCIKQQQKNQIPDHLLKARHIKTQKSQTSTSNQILNALYRGISNRIQFVGGKSAINKVDTTSKNFKYYRLKGMDLIMQSQGKTYVMLPGTKNLRKQNTFQIKIKKIKQWVYLGLVDKRLKEKQWCGNSQDDNAIFFGNNLKLFDGKQWRQKCGTKFEQGDIVKVRVDFETMNVQWEVGNDVKYKWVCSKLKFKEIQWVPMVAMGFKNDTIQWID